MQIYGILNDFAIGFNAVCGNKKTRKLLGNFRVLVWLVLCLINVVVQKGVIGTQLGIVVTIGS
jgi:hypothetical protein